ncbi:DUF2934 domain-containing protein [Pseudomonas sp. BGr12]|uniref:DUF2934 domain-containing protein n=1 Tax=unclassified Pseudomonas TaxID=196821 RepID=UPI001781099B|nr:MULTISPECIES: DUF2934 domain-containing protein [unclassified Pseudomonas]MBD9579118.1 DUF2934 domain-containing protein [Pseudomonas sp. PDM23]MBD9672896.1 DUF2934 domain-containing protein [Pseudomonas sp. PDM21]MDL2428219.1 DUF2934 domain-containing protein [Pseudomonas sp. BJa5]
MKVNERRVRELAYQIWESEGRPEGQHDRHWRMARSLAEAEAGNADGTQEPVKPRFEGDKEPEKPALLQEPPRRKGRLPKADPEVPDQDEGETVTPTPPEAERKSPAKAKPTRSAPTVTPTAKRKPKPSPAEAATPGNPAAPKPRTKKQSI